MSGTKLLPAEIPEAHGTVSMTREHRNIRRNKLPGIGSEERAELIDDFARHRHID